MARGCPATSGDGSRNRKPDRFREPDAERERAARERMTEPERTLDTQQRDIVEKTVAEPCRIRGWHLHAVNCQYVERNPLRANLVRRTEAWQYGSLWRWTRKSKPQPQWLSTWSVARTPNWRESVNQPLSETHRRSN